MHGATRMIQILVLHELFTLRHVCHLFDIYSWHYWKDLMPLVYSMGYLSYKVRFTSKVEMF